MAIEAVADAGPAAFVAADADVKATSDAVNAEVAAMSCSLIGDGLGLVKIKLE